MDPTRQFCTFHLGDMLLGVEVEEVQEVLRFQETTAVPRASALVQGLINLRGNIVTAINLRQRFGMPLPTEGWHPMNVVLFTDGEAVSLLVDEIGDVVEVGEEEFEPAPETLRSGARELVRGV